MKTPHSIPYTGEIPEFKEGYILSVVGMEDNVPYVYNYIGYAGIWIGLRGFVENGGFDGQMVWLEKYQFNNKRWKKSTLNNITIHYLPL